MRNTISEVRFTVYNTEYNHSVMVKEDGIGSGLSLVEIVFNPDPEFGKEPVRLPAIDTNMAREVASALLKIADHIDLRDGKK